MDKGMKQLLLSADPVSELRSLIQDRKIADFEPVVADLKMEIPSGYHHKDNLEHSIRVLGNAIQMEEEAGSGSPDLVLRTAALLHDIGKPRTRAFGTRGKVTFRNHEVVGAKMIPRVLARHGYDTGDVELVKRLVALHMRSHGFDNAKWNDSAVRRLMTDAQGRESVDRLMVVFKADCTTKSDQKRAARFSSVDNLKAEVERVEQQDARKALRPALNGLEVMELLGLEPGRELGAVMRFLNSGEGIHLDKMGATEEVLRRFG